MKNKKLYFSVYAVLYIVTLFFILHFAYSVEVLKATLKDFNEIMNFMNLNIADKPFIFMSTIANKQQTTAFFMIYTVAFMMIVANDYFNTAKFKRKGIEHGSARWGNLAEIRQLADKKTENNMILSKNIKMSMNSRKTERNNNIVVFGGAGTGKTRYFLIPNILQEHSSFIITDPKGSLTKNVASKLKSDGYEVKILNLVDMQHSDNYNPFNYLSKDEEIFILIDNFMENTDGKVDNTNDPFWKKSEKALLTCIIYYLYDKGKESEKNFTTVLEYVHEFGKPGSNFTKKIIKLSKEEPFHVSVSNYKTVLMASEKTLKSILISAGVRLALTNLKPVRNLLSSDTLELDKIGDRKTALFVIVPDTSNSFNFIVSILYTQLLQKLVEKADKSPNESLNIPVRMMLDEFANCGKIPNFDILVATLRSRGISVSIVLQNLAQLKNMYEKTWETILGNCDTLIFLGGKEQGLLKYLSEQFGKETVNTRTRGLSKSKQRSYSTNDGIISRNLITIDELDTMDNSDCIVSVRGFRAIKDKKYNLKKHKGYSDIGESNEINFYYVHEYKKTKEYEISKDFEVRITDVDIEKSDKVVEVINDEVIEKTQEEYEDSLLALIRSK